MSVEHFVIPQMPEAMPLAARDREKGSYGVCCWTPPRPHSPAGRAVAAVVPKVAAEDVECWCDNGMDGLQL